MKSVLFLLVFLPTLLRAQGVYRLRAVEKAMIPTRTAKTAEPKWTRDSTTLIVVDFSERLFRFVLLEEETFAWVSEQKLENQDPQTIKGVWAFECVDKRGEKCQIQLTLMKEGFEENAILVIFYSDYRFGYTAKILK